MQHTTNYNLNVVETTDKILESITALGSNATSIDTLIKNVNDNIGNVETILQTLNNGTGV